MRATTLTAALVAALAITATSASQAQAQVIVSPNVAVTPYGVYPYYSTGYHFVNPYTGIRTYGWSNPWNYGNFVWYNGAITPWTTARPYGFMSWPNYVYRGWNGRWRW
jgi:hypothetical protein